MIVKLSKYMKTLLTSLIIILLFTQSMSYAFDQSLIDKIDAHVKESMIKGSIPGLSVAIISGDSETYLNSYGNTGSGKVKVINQTPFIIGTPTQSITALAIKKLTNEGKIDLEWPLEHYMPWFQLLKPDGSKILIADLVTHTSGLSTSSGEHPNTFSENYDLKSLSERIAKSEKTAFVSTSDKQYSALNYILLGHLIEVVTERSYESYVTDEIFTPIGMHTTNFQEKLTGRLDLAQGHRNIYGFVVPTNLQFPNGLISTHYMVGTIEDLSKYASLMLNNGYYEQGGNWLSIFNDNELPTPHDTSEHLYYDFLWQTQTQVDPSNHNGYNGAIGQLPNYTSAMLINPDKKMAVLVLSNLSNPYETPAINAQTIANDITDLINGTPTYTFEPKENISMWLLPVLAMALMWYMVKTLRLRLKKRKGLIADGETVSLKRMNKGLITRGLLSAIAYLGLPSLMGQSWQFFASASPEYGFPILLIIVFNLTMVILEWILMIKNQKNL